MQELLGLPLDGSAHGAQIDSMIGLVHWLMLALFVGWAVFFSYTLVRYRRSRNPKADYVGVKSHTSTYIEVAVAVFEGVLLVGFAIPLWANVVNDVPNENEATVVRVVAEQFAWNVHYPGTDGVFGKADIKLISADNPLGLDRSDPACKDDIATINQMNLPVGKPVIIHLSTKDVIHSFSIPLYRVKHDAIPGENIPMWFTPVKTTRELQQASVKTYSIVEGMQPVLSMQVAMADYAGTDGVTILKKGDAITEDAIALLQAAGITEISAAPDTPTEITCAQLCGLGHFRMRGFVSVQTQEEFDAWLAEEAAYLEE
ncbi:MAG: cytochrome c oxidase subunit II [Bacteroidota bacterium]